MAGPLEEDEMSGDLEVLLRGSKAYGLAHKALEAMEGYQVWPTPLNFELWLHFVAAKDTPLGKDICRIVEERIPFTDELAEQLAARHLPRIRLNGELLTAGDALSKELDTVSRAIESARESSEAYGEQLATASQSLDAAAPPAIREMVQTLASATERVQRENKTLEDRLADTTAEVSRLRQHLELVRRDAMTDGLTNLANRKAFDEALERAVEASNADGQPLTLAVLDIDHFKKFNDTWGHQTGDQVIRYVASVIARAGVPPRTAARYGGEEFALVLPGVDAQAALAVIEEIREEVASRVLKRRSTNQDLGAVTVSAGLAERLPGEPQASLLERADAALYASKRAGRNRTTKAASKVSAAA
jgi:diguanylate cyclase